MNTRGIDQRPMISYLMLIASDGWNKPTRPFPSFEFGAEPSLDFAPILGGSVKGYVFFPGSVTQPATHRLNYDSMVILRR